MSVLIWETVYYMIETLHSDFVLAFLGGICQGQAYSVCGQKEERVFSDIEHRWTWTMIMLKDLTRILGNLLNGNSFTIKTLKRKLFSTVSSFFLPRDPDDF